MASQRLVGALDSGITAQASEFWHACLPCGYTDLTRLQAARSSAASEALTHQAGTTPDYHNQGRSLPTPSSTLLALTNQSSAEGYTRALLQAEQQQQLDLQGSSTAYEDVDSNQIASETGIIADTAIRTDTASLSETKPEALLAQRHEPQSAVQEYQPSNAAILNEPRLIAAAASQASQSLADSIEETAGEDQFDAWPLVDPPLQDALHEVQPITPGCCKSVLFGMFQQSLCWPAVFRQQQAASSM